ncbi:hypothetical protein GF324_12065 [bacterium]|nr:hypothetical protein [bacterium]
MTPWQRKAIVMGAKALMKAGPYVWLVYQAKLGLDSVLLKLYEWIGSVPLLRNLCGPCKDRAQELKVKQKRLAKVAGRLQPIVPSEETMKEKKPKKWTFFKVILVLGGLIALAIFILDKLLPKPYDEDELDDAWKDDDSWKDTAAESAAEASGTPPVSNDGAYEMKDEDASDEGEEEKEEEKKTTSRKRTTKKSDSED